MADYPDHQHELGFSSKRYAWVSDGASGSVSHIALTPRQFNPVIGLSAARPEGREFLRGMARD
jgi:hypothetical protein